MSAGKIDKDMVNEEEYSSKLSLPTNRNAVARLIEQLLMFLVFKHSEYLERLSLSYKEGKGTLKDIKSILSEDQGKIFPVNANFVESEGNQDDTDILEDVIKAVVSKCKDVLAMEKHAEAKSFKDKSSNEKFYKKLYWLVSGAIPDCSTRNKVQESRRDMPAPRSSNFGEGTCSVEQRVSELEAMLEQTEATASKYKNESEEFKAKITALEAHLKTTEDALDAIATEYYGLKAENEKQERQAVFRELMQLNRGSVSSTESSTRPEETSTITSSDSGRQVITEESTSKAEQSLTYVPTNTIELELYNTYKLLLLQISQRLLQEDRVQLRDWAANTHSVEVYGDAYQVLVELDKKGVISSSNLTVLKDFFERILRIDLVLIIERFLAGDYTLLRNTLPERKVNQNVRANVLQANAERPSHGAVQNQATADRSSPRVAVEDVIVVPKHSLGRNVTSEQPLQAAAGSTRVEVDGARYSGSTGSNESNLSKPAAQSRQANKNQQAMSGDSNKNHSVVQQQRNKNRQSSNTSANNTNGGPWLCDHYKRRCLVKFDCCERFWPCHRCHNNKSNCGRKKLKSRDIRLIKCVQCEKEQPFNEGSQFCSGCGIKFADYFCAQCKHLTGTDDKPYHCDKCGICRIHGDRSFHCDVCGVCLDVQLRNNHKCRAGSAHDECCICLEDAFTGCQILPCSHKVHKECANQMIRSGITRCPICRESFAHKLEKRPTSKLNRKHYGKK